MSKKELFADELISGMQESLRKQASAETPKLSRAAECLHSALEILEEQGLHARADEVLHLLEKLAHGTKVTKTAKVHSLQQLMEAGVTQRDLREFARGNPTAVAKLNLVLRKLGLADHEIAKFLGPGHVMSEEEARKTINPNEPGSILEFESLGPKPVEPGPGEEVLEFETLAAVKKKSRKPSRPDKDPATRGWTPEKGVKNLEEYGTPLNVYLADDCAIDVPPPGKLTKDNIDPELAELLDVPSFDVDASDDELMGLDIKEDSLEVFEKEIPLEDFEDERD